MLRLTPEARLFFPIIAATFLLAPGPEGFVAGEEEAPALIQKAREALDRGDSRAFSRLVTGDRAAAYEAVEILLNAFEPGDSPLVDALARAYAEVYEDRCLVERAASFRSWTSDQRASREEAKRIKAAAKKALEEESRPAEAMRGFERAGRMFHDLGDHREEGRCLANQGGMAAILGEHSKALALLGRARPALQRAGDLPGMISLELHRAYAIEDGGDLDGAEAALKNALRLSRDLDDRHGEGAVLVNLGSVVYGRGDLKQAERLFRQAGAIGREIGLAEMEASAWNNLANVHAQSGDRLAAVRDYLKSVEIARRAGLKRNEADTEFNLADIHRQMDEYAEARRHVARARQIAAAIEDPILQARIEAEDGMILNEEGRHAVALSFLEAAEAKLAGVDAPAVVANLHGDRAVAHYYLGDYGRALAEIRFAIQKATEASRPGIVANHRRNLGLFLFLLGDAPAGLSELETAARLHAQVGDVIAQAGDLDAIGVLRFRRGDLAGGRKALEAAVAALPEATARQDRAEAMADLAELELASGSGRRAVAWGLIRGASEVFADLDDLHGITLAAILEIEAALADGDVAAARSAVARARILARGRRELEHEWQVRWAEGRVAEAAGDLPAAIRHYRRSIAEVEHLRGLARPAPWRAAILEDRIAPYRALVRLHRRRGEIEEAYRIARSAKARTFTEQLRPPDVDVAFASTRRPSPELAPAAVVPVDRLRPLLAEREVLLDFFLDGQELLVFLVRREGVSLRVVPPEGFSPGGLDSLLEALRYPGRPGSKEGAVTEAWRRAARRAGQVLLQPLASDLEGSDHLLIVPAGALHGVPFAALEVNGRRLVERWDLSLLPAAESLFSRGRPPAPRSGATLAVADPATDRSAGMSLPGAVEEAKLVEGVAGGEIEMLVGGAARESTFRRVAARFSRIHLATHGRIDRVAPARSHILLAPGDGEDGRLEAGEIATLELNASLVVLSGCETGVEGGIVRGDPPGDERTGLARAFLAAGARTVVASLWEMSDRAARTVIPQLYPRLRGRSVAAALSGLQRDLLAGRIKDESGRSLDHPFYWAGIIAYGAGDDAGSGAPPHVASLVD